MNVNMAPERAFVPLEYVTSPVNRDELHQI
jgi:hypothetical protein